MNGFAGHKERSTTKEIERHYPHIVELKGAIERFRSQAERNACLVQTTSASRIAALLILPALSISDFKR